MIMLHIVFAGVTRVHWLPQAMPLLDVQCTQYSVHDNDELMTSMTSRTDNGQKLWNTSERS